MARAADQQARFLVATNELSTDKLSDEARLSVYKGQGSVERGFRFLRISAVSGLLGRMSKKPSRLIALSFIMVLWRHGLSSGRTALAPALAREPANPS